MIELIGRGKAHVGTMAALARVIQADGLNKPALAAIAGLGTGGENDSNSERDLFALASGLWGFNIEPYEIRLELQAFRRKFGNLSDCRCFFLVLDHSQG